MNPFATPKLIENKSVKAKKLVAKSDRVIPTRPIRHPNNRNLY